MPGPAAGLGVDVPDDDRGTVAGGHRPGPVRGHDQVPYQLLVGVELLDRCAAPVVQGDHAVVPQLRGARRQRPEVHDRGRSFRLRRHRRPPRAHRSGWGQRLPTCPEHGRAAVVGEVDGQGLGRPREGATDPVSRTVPSTTSMSLMLQRVPPSDSSPFGTVDEQVHPAAVRAECTGHRESADLGSLRDDPGRAVGGERAHPRPVALCPAPTSTSSVGDGATTVHPTQSRRRDVIGRRGSRDRPATRRGRRRPRRTGPRRRRRGSPRTGRRRTGSPARPARAR